jgi:hypothetical protein
MNATFKNHETLLKFILDLDYRSELVNSYIEDINFSNVDSITKAYWQIVKELKPNSMEDLFYMLIPDLDDVVNNWDYDLDFVKQIFDFKFKYFDDCTYIIAEDYAFINMMINHPERVVKRLKNNDSIIIYDSPYLYTVENTFDHLTSEFVERVHYIVPAFECIKINEDFILVREATSGDLEFVVDNY